MIYLPSNNSTNIVTNKIVLQEHAVIQKIQMKNKCSNDFLNENRTHLPHILRALPCVGVE